MQRVAIVIGTRPEAIKLAPVVWAFRSVRGIDVTVISTGQHRELLRQTLGALELRADIDLDLMLQDQRLPALTSRAIAAVGSVLSDVKYHAVVVQGDTTTAMASALAAFYGDVPVAHVEAGLRTGWSRSPFPEEANRRIIGELARWHFAPTSASALSIAGAPKPRRIAVTGNTAIDTLRWTMKRLEVRARSHARSRVRRMLVTLHRRESQGQQHAELCEMVHQVAHDYAIAATVSVHPNPRVAEVVEKILGRRPGIRIVRPLDYFSWVREMADTDLILTDSGGIQEEAPTLNVPVVVLRNTTERPEGVAAGCAILAGSVAAHAQPIVRSVIEDADLRRAMALARNPYGDGCAAERIVSILQTDLEEMSASGLGGARGAARPGSAGSPTASSKFPLTGWSDRPVGLGAGAGG